MLSASVNRVLWTLAAVPKLVPASCASCPCCVGKLTCRQVRRAAIKRLLLHVVCVFRSVLAYAALRLPRKRPLAWLSQSRLQVRDMSAEIGYMSAAVDTSATQNVSTEATAVQVDPFRL